MREIRALLARVEAATGEDRKIDAQLALIVAKWTYEKRKGDRYEYWRDPDDASPTSSYHPRRELPRYTASIDAALALVERMLPRWSVENMGQYSNGMDGDRLAWGVELTDGTHAMAWDDSRPSGQAPTAALAIIAALLTALQAKQASDV